MFKVTIAQTNGMTEEKTFDDVLLGCRWAILKIQSDCVRAVKIEKENEYDKRNAERT